MGGRHQNVEDPSTWGRDISKTKFDLLGFFLNTLKVTDKIRQADFLINSIPWSPENPNFSN